MLGRAVLEWMSDNSKVVQDMMYSRNPSSRSSLQMQNSGKAMGLWPLMAKQMQQ